MRQIKLKAKRFSFSHSQSILFLYLKKMELRKNKKSNLLKKTMIEEIELKQIIKENEKLNETCSTIETNKTNIRQTKYLNYFIF